MGKERARCRRPSDFDDDKIRRWERAFSSHRRQLKAARKFCAPKTARCGGDDVVYRLLLITLNPVYYPIDSQRGCFSRPALRPVPFKQKIHAQRTVAIRLRVSSWVIAHSTGTSADPMTPLVYVASVEGPIR
jgi:hypothetical protein